MKNKILKKKSLIRLLKISDPFLMLDFFSEKKEGKKGQGKKRISLKDWFFKSHFLNEPVMPGSLQIEAMLQTIVLIVYKNSVSNFDRCLITKTKSNFYSKIDKAGELKIDAQIIKNEKNFIEAKATIFFKKRKVSDGFFRFVKSGKLPIRG